jgi:hypothetical protein
MGRPLVTRVRCMRHQVTWLEGGVLGLFGFFGGVVADSYLVGGDLDLLGDGLLQLDRERDELRVPAQ